MFKKVKTSTRLIYINLEQILEFDMSNNGVVMTNGAYYELTNESMAELYDVLRKPSVEERIAIAEERIATALESALDGDGFYCKCLVSNV